MRNVWLFFDRMNLWMWVLGIFVAHALMYLLLGTDTWLATTLLATSVYGAALIALKLVARRFVEKKERDTI